MKKETYYKIRPIDDQAYCVVIPDELGLSIQDWLDGMNEGEQLVVERISMTEKEFNKLPEYEG